MTLDELMDLANHKWIAHYTTNQEINQKRQDIATYMPDWGNDWYSDLFRSTSARRMPTPGKILERATWEGIKAFRGIS